MLKTPAHSKDHAGTTGDKALILLAVAFAYASNFWPGRALLGWGLNALGNPPYTGFVGIFVPHLLLYSTFMAAVSALLWWAFVRARLLEPPKFGKLRTSILFGIIGGLAALAVTLLVILATMPKGTIHWITPDAWKIAGNVFSNFFEEFVFRGFLLIALRRVVGFWPGAVASSALWAFTHSQYPLTLQATILVVGVGFCWLARRAQSLWAPYFAHEVLDLLGDSLIG
jgi:membrane protease YdiL (CAAX protease family)